MLQFDDHFFEEMGASHLPRRTRERFAAAAGAELERRIGLQISHELPKELLREFSAILDGSDADNAAWLEAQLPGYQTQDPYLTLQRSGVSARKLVGLTASALWLERYCPDYRDRVERCSERFRQELYCFRRQLFSPEAREAPKESGARRDGKGAVSRA